MWAPDSMSLTKRQWSWLEKHVDRCAKDAHGSVTDALSLFFKSKTIKPHLIHEMVFSDLVIVNIVGLFWFHDEPMYVEFTATREVDFDLDKTVYRITHWDVGLIKAMYPPHERDVAMKKFKMRKATPKITVLNK